MWFKPQGRSGHRGPRAVTASRTPADRLSAQFGTHLPRHAPVNAGREAGAWSEYGGVSTFARVSQLSKGYEPGEVDEFFEFARRDYEDPNPTMDATSVRRTTFGMRRGGYDTGDVDAALDRLEDALAARAREEEIADVGQDKHMERLLGRARQLQGRLGRPSGERFRRAEGDVLAYDVDQVDELCDTLADYFKGGIVLSPDHVRRAAFAPRRGTDGYREGDVDAFLDTVVDVMALVE